MVNKLIVFALFSLLTHDGSGRAPAIVKYSIKIL